MHPPIDASTGPACPVSEQLCPEVFTYPFNGETSVSVMGNYSPTGWTVGTPMVHSGTGPYGSEWYASVPVPYDQPVQYKFMVNGSSTWVTDPNNPMIADAGGGNTNSIDPPITCATPSCAESGALAAGVFDWRDAVIYFTFIDRFNIGQSANPKCSVAGASTGQNSATSANYLGGNWAGVTDKIQSGYFTTLGVNTLWITVPVKNADTVLGAGVGGNCSGTTCQPTQYQYTAYHGYWPTDPGSIEPCFGTESELKALVAAAHKANLKVLFDYAMVDVHTSSTLYTQNPTWFTPYCQCGAPGCSDYNDFKCWFAPYLAHYDFTNSSAARSYSVGKALGLVQQYGNDAFRLDAIKQVDPSWLASLRPQITTYESQVADGGVAQHFYMVGETYDFDDMAYIRSFINPDTGLDGQFDFPLRYRIVDAMLLRDTANMLDYPIADGDAWTFNSPPGMQGLQQFLDFDDSYYPTGSVMSTFVGNQDLPRSIHFRRADPPVLAGGERPGRAHDRRLGQRLDQRALARDRPEHVRAPRQRVRRPLHDEGGTARLLWRRDWPAGRRRPGQPPHDAVVELLACAADPPRPARDAPQDPRGTPLDAARHALDPHGRHRPLGLLRDDHGGHCRRHGLRRHQPQRQRLDGRRSPHRPPRARRQGPERPPETTTSPPGRPVSGAATWRRSETRGRAAAEPTPRPARPRERAQAQSSSTPVASSWSIDGSCLLQSASPAHAFGAPSGMTVAWTRARLPAASLGMKNECPCIRRWAPVALSLSSIQHPISWQTAVTMPTVVNGSLAYFAGSFITSASVSSWAVNSSPKCRAGRLPAPGAPVELLGAGAAACGAPLDSPAGGAWGSTTPRRLLGAAATAPGAAATALVVGAGKLDRFARGVGGSMLGGGSVVHAMREMTQGRTIEPRSMFVMFLVKGRRCVPPGSERVASLPGAPSQRRGAWRRASPRIHSPQSHNGLAHPTARGSQRPAATVGRGAPRETTHVKLRRSGGGRAVFCAAAAALLLGAAPARAVVPHRSMTTLSSSNGLGALVYDATQYKITEFLEHAYQAASATTSSRNFAYDSYPGVRIGTTGTWLNTVAPSVIEYLPATGIIHTQRTLQGLTLDEYVFAPMALAENASVMLVKVTGDGTTGPVDVYSIFNYLLGTGSPTPGDDGETASYDPTNDAYYETGPSGVAMAFASILPSSYHGCTPNNPFALLNAGENLMDDTGSGGAITGAVEGFQSSLGTPAAGAVAWAGWIAVLAPDANGAGAITTARAWMNGRSPAQLLAAEQAAWAAWIKPAPAGARSEEAMLHQQSQAILRMGQVTESGAAGGQILAAITPGEWNISWVRDMAYSTVALVKSGHYAEAKAALAFQMGASVGGYQSYLSDTDGGAGEPYQNLGVPLLR